MALSVSTASDVLFSISSVILTAKISDTQVAFTYPLNPSGNTVGIIDLSSGYSKTYYMPSVEHNPAFGAYQTLPYDNRIVIAQVDNFPVGMRIGIVDFDTSNPGVVNEYYSSDISSPPGLIAGPSDPYFVAFALTSSNAGYVIIENSPGDGSLQQWLQTFSISGNSISVDSPSLIANYPADTTREYPTYAIGLYNGQALQWWAREVWNGSSYDSDPATVCLVDQGSIGSYGEGEAWNPDANSVTLDQIAFAFVSPQIIIGGPADGFFSEFRAATYDGSLVLGPLEGDTTYPPTSNPIISAVSGSLGYQKGLFAWRLSGSNQAYIAEMTPDPDTGELNVDQGTRINLFNVVSLHYCFTMKSGTEAIIIYFYTLGGNNVRAGHVIGVSGEASTPSTHRLWMYKSMDGGLSWASRGIQTA